MKTEQEYLFEFLLRLGDDQLILGHRLSEWCGHAPILEEDIALANISLDCIGQSSALLKLAAEIEEKGRTEDTLAYFREATQFKNIQLVEQPNGDFAFTIARQFLFDVYVYLLYEKIQHSTHPTLSGIAAKAFKEITYHLRHSKEWMLRLGDGTEESHKRLQNAVDELWTFTDELFAFDEVENALVSAKIIPPLISLQQEWNEMVKKVLAEATIKLFNEQCYKVKGSRKGKHSEHLGHLLAEMQILARSFPTAKW